MLNLNIITSYIWLLVSNIDIWYLFLPSGLGARIIPQLLVTGGGQSEDKDSLGEANPQPEWSREVRKRMERGLKRIQYFEPTTNEPESEVQEQEPAAGEQRAGPDQQQQRKRRKVQQETELVVDAAAGATMTMTDPADPAVPGAALCVVQGEAGEAGDVVVVDAAAGATMTMTDPADPAVPGAAFCVVQGEAG